MKGRKNSPLKKRGKNVPRLNEYFVDKSKVWHQSLYFDIPNVYRDKEFSCKTCGKDEIWTARQQKWWYEKAGGALESTAIHCRQCREASNRKRRKQKKHMQEMADKKPHPNEAFLINKKRNS